MLSLECDSGKPSWWEKIKETALVEKWKQESLDQQEDEYRIRQLTDRVANTPPFHPLADMRFSPFEGRQRVSRVAWLRVY